MENTATSSSFSSSLSFSSSSSSSFNANFLASLLFADDVVTDGAIFYATLNAMGFFSILSWIMLSCVRTTNATAHYPWCGQGFARFNRCVYVFRVIFFWHFASSECILLFLIKNTLLILIRFSFVTFTIHTYVSLCRTHIFSTTQNEAIQYKSDGIRRHNYAEIIKNF